MVMQTDIYNIKGEKVGNMELPACFSVAWNPRLVAQVFDAQERNARTPRAHTKDRAEVRGGGKKPYAQKHTGCARHGSRRSPLWVGGGTTFGPRNERDFSVKINTKMRRKALTSLLSKKVSDHEFFILDSLHCEDKKTKRIATFLKTFFKTVRPSVLFVPEHAEKNIFFAGRNIPRAYVTRPESLNVYDCMRYKYIVCAQNAISTVQKIISQK